MSMQNKAQMTEAVLFFNERGVCKQMLFPEFEALLDNVVNMPEFADEQMRLVYVLINPRLMVRAAVFFYLDFDERGSADSGWNLPLRHLADNAGRGPDLGESAAPYVANYPVPAIVNDLLVGFSVVILSLLQTLGFRAWRRA